MQFIDMAHDLDSSMDAWDGLYRLAYRGKLSKYFNFDALSDSGTSSSCKRYYAVIDKEKHPELVASFGKFMIAGDCDFNFNERKVALFQKVLEPDDFDALAICSKHHHDFRNFTLMPINGAMNNAKGTMRCTGDFAALDRPDLFISELANFYDGRESKVFSRCTEKYLPGLLWYLGLFDGVYDYCSSIYLIDDNKLIDKLIESGHEPLNCRERVLSYMGLACDYWEARSERLNSLGVVLS